MREGIVRCTNCGKISRREHILPLCNDCFIGLEDYEEFLIKATNDVEIAVSRKPVRKDYFLRV
jgi:hypothetical protein